MEWIESIRQGIAYIEENITEDISLKEIADKVNISSFYFQKGFSMLCGYSLSEYIRMRKLTLAGSEVSSSNTKIIDIAIKYGYDSPDSFTKAFTRFHGATPTAVRKEGAMPETIKETNKKIFSEWLPNCTEYEIAAGYNIEMYNDPNEYKNGTADSNYYSEIWIPVKKIV